MLGKVGASPRPKAVGLTHMAFQSRDIAGARDFYSKVLGYGRVLELAGPNGLPRSIRARINGAQWVELRPEAAPMTDRLIQFGFRVDDAEAMRAYLGSRGLAVPASASRDELGNISFAARDPDGHEILFSQLETGGWPARDASASEGPRAISDCLMHLGFDVRSLEAANAFYREVLGFEEVWRGSSDERTLAWVQLRLPGDPLKNYIEYMLYDEEPSLQQLGVFNHFGLEVQSMQAAMEEVSRRAGARDYPRTVAYDIGKCRHRLANVYDPDGSRAELMERRTFDGSITPSSPLPPPR